MNYEFASRMDSLKASAIREILKFTADPKVISFAAGNPSVEAFPVEDVKRITADILDKDPINALQYSVTEGYIPLKEKLKEDLKVRHGIGREFDDLIITSGAQQAIDLTCKAFCNKGDTLICENPSFIGSLNAFKSYEVNLVGVEVENDGISIEKLEKALSENPNTKLLYVIPNFQNPSGVTMSLEKRHAVYDLCVKHNVKIIEDNPYGELRFKGEYVPSIKSFDTEGIVMYCGTFSKILSPGLRVGFLYGPKTAVGKVVVLKQTNDVHTSIFSQMIAYEFMNTCNLPKHLAFLSDLYKHKAELMVNEIHNNFSEKITFVEPHGGLFLWCTLPSNVDMIDFCTTAVKKNVACVPGTAFMPHETDITHSFRLNYSTPTDEQIIKGIKILGDLTKEVL